MTESATASEQEQSSVAAEIFAGVIGAGVSLGCLLPPLLHLVTGPLGPAIGGFVAANKVPKSARAQLIVAITIATARASFVGGIVSLAAHVAAANELPDWFPTTAGRILGLAGVVWVYAGILATVGTAVQGKVGAK